MPIIKTLEMIFDHNKVREFCDIGHCSNDGLLRDYCHGKQFKEHLLFMINDTAIQICLYFDELEAVNPLGSRRGIHKIGVLYSTVKNIPPKYNSSLGSIHLLATFACIDLK